MNNAIKKRQEQLQIQNLIDFWRGNHNLDEKLIPQQQIELPNYLDAQSYPTNITIYSSYIRDTALYESGEEKPNMMPVLGMRPSTITSPEAKRKAVTHETPSKEPEISKKSKVPKS